MMRLGSVVRAMAEAGAGVDMIVKVVETTENNEEERLARKREASRLRSAAYRATKKALVTPVTPVTHTQRDAPDKSLETQHKLPSVERDAQNPDLGTIGVTNEDRPFFVGEDPPPPTSLEKGVGKTEKPKRQPRQVDPGLQREFQGTFWRTYPRRVGVGAALKAFIRARQIATLDQIMEGLDRYVEQRKGDDPQFTAHASTWLNQQRWLDEPQTNVIPLMRRFQQPVARAPRNVGERILMRQMEAANAAHNEPGAGPVGAGVADGQGPSAGLDGRPALPAFGLRGM